MIRTIFFDFGNVIGYFDHSRAVAKMLPFTPLNATELTLAIYGGTLEDDYEIGKLTTDEFIRTAIANGQLTCSVQQFHDAFVDIFTPNTELAALIPRLRPHYRLVLASNTNAAHFARYREQFREVLQHFDHLVVSQDAGARKPHAEFYQYAQQYANADPSECLFIDDLATNIEAAHRHGWHGIVYRSVAELETAFRAQGIELRVP